MVDVLTGVELARQYYWEVVLPLLECWRRDIAHAAGRLGSGSDVLGLDDDMSRDHDWGLRLTLLVDDCDVETVARYLTGALPDSFQGWPTSFATTWDPTIRPRIEVDTPEHFVWSRLGIGVEKDWGALDWLAVTGQSVLEVTAGDVFVDSHGGISEIRRRLTWYPDDVWCYVVAADWHRIGQLLPSMGRAGSRGDDPGSRILTARIVSIAMHLAFLLQRRWPPYDKWMGTLFAQLPVAAAIAAPLEAAMKASEWPQRQAALSEMLTGLHDFQRSVGLPTGQDALELFWDRPFCGVRRSVTELLLGAVTDPVVSELPVGVGSVEQWVDNVDVLTDPQRRVDAAAALRRALVH